MPSTNPLPPETQRYDVIVVGSGVGGVTAALTAAVKGMKVLVLEKADHFGGTTAWSAGAIWLPGNRHLESETDPRAPFEYIKNLMGNRIDPGVVEAMLQSGPIAIDFLEQNTSVRFRNFGGIDYRTDVAGSSTRSRTIDPEPFDDRQLGDKHRLLAEPFGPFTIFHGMQTDNPDLRDLVNALSSPAALMRSLRLIGRHYFRLAWYGRSTRRLRGNALAGMLLKSALDLKIDIQLGTSCAQLLTDGNQVTGVLSARNENRQRYLAKHAVVLATGGFSADSDMRAQHTAFATMHLSLPPATNVGDGIKMAMDIGARLAENNLTDYCFAPVSKMKLASGSEVLFPHFLRDRSLPGCIAVGRSGKRFVNEGCSYHDFVLAMHRADAVPAFLICDHKFLRKYGFGLVRPFPFRYREFLRNGYLVKAPALRALADALGIDAQELERTVSRMNDYAKIGDDPEFHRGADAFSRTQGDAAHGPNPSLGRIGAGPYYSIRVYPGDTGTTCGLVANADAQVLDKNDEPIPGLYACGMDMNNPTMGAHQSPGANIGPAIAFGYRAGVHIAAKATRS